MEHKIGEIFEYNGEWYQCVKSPDGSCKHCDMNFGGKCPIPIKECVASARSDLFYVIFKKLEKVGEPKIINGKKVQLLKSKYCKNCAFWDNNDCTFTTCPRTCMGGEYGVYVEIKQNKEDMEESVEEKLFCDKVAKANAEYMKVKLNSSLKPFDLEAAKAGKPVCTRDGRKARIICFDRKDVRPIVALIKSDNGDEGVYYYYADGLNLDNYPSVFDLMMLSEKKEGWVNVYKGGLLDTKSYPTKKEAFDKAHLEGYVDTVKISWEEQIMLVPKYIVYKTPVSSGDYYGCLMNTISDIIGVFKSKEKAIEFCENMHDVKIKEIDWEE